MYYTNPLPLPPKTDKFHNNFLKEMHTTNPLPLLYNIQDNIKNINHNMCKNKINNYYRKQIINMKRNKMNKNI